MKGAIARGASARGAWFIFRFGALLFTLSAFACFWNGDIVEAAWVFLAAGVIQAIKAPVMWWMRVVEGIAALALTIPAGLFPDVSRCLRSAGSCFRAAPRF